MINKQVEQLLPVMWHDGADDALSTKLNAEQKMHWGFYTLLGWKQVFQVTLNALVFSLDLDFKTLNFGVGVICEFSVTL